MSSYYGTSKKIIPYSKLLDWRKELIWPKKYDNYNIKLVVTNGCFDLLHVGHVEYLEEAREQGGKLLVGVNNDDSVRWLKGKGRPINCALYRAKVLAALECVDFVSIFPDKSASSFLEKARPDVYVKGGDYSLETLDTEELEILKKYKSNIYFSKLVEGVSTSKILDKKL
jgi:rfaE bifunctional protein nucleotidyltransferase chain/domain